MTPNKTTIEKFFKGEEGEQGRYYTIPCISAHIHGKRSNGSSF